MFTFASSGGITVHVHEWLPASAPRGIVQIAHGMGEHAARYAHLAGTLTAAGFAVYANDHRGHGRTMAAEPGELGPDGWNLLVADMARVSTMVKDRHPGRPLVLLGHSLGSFASQQYILDHSDLLAGLALSGTTAVDALLPHLSVSEDGDALAQFNQPFEPARTGFDWLTRDEAQVDAYIADAWCGFSLTPDALVAMFGASPQWAELTTVRKELPVYVFVGARDPLNAGLALTDLLVQRYRDAGITDVTYRTYAEGRHEILNELNRDEVEADLLTWLDRVTA